MVSACGVADNTTEADSEPKLDGGKRLLAMSE
jgi:hypothetical protein